MSTGAIPVRYPALSVSPDTVQFLRWSPDRNGFVETPTPQPSTGGGRNTGGLGGVYVRPAEYFTLGKIPTAWQRRANLYAGRTRASVVGEYLWHEVGLQKTLVSLHFSWKHLRERFGVNKWAGKRGLEALERAALVHVVRQPGRNPIVTILQPPRTDGFASGLMQTWGVRLLRGLE